MKESSSLKNIAGGAALLQNTLKPKDNRNPFRLIGTVFCIVEKCVIMVKNMKNIEWNEVTWYSKLIALFLFVALPFIGFYYGMEYQKTIISIDKYSLVTTGSSTQNQESIGSAYYSNPAEWQTDSNNNGFSISYPIDFDIWDNYTASPSIDWRANSNNVSGVKYFMLTVPRAFEPQTNFIDTRFTVGASSDKSAVAQCMTADPSGGPAMATSTADINGVQFTVFYSADAGAGNYYETTSYRTLHNSRCYAIEYTIHSSQIANYPSSYNLQPFDKNKIDSLMKNIIGTFKFTK